MTNGSCCVKGQWANTYIRVSPRRGELQPSRGLALGSAGDALKGRRSTASSGTRMRTQCAVDGRKVSHRPLALIAMNVDRRQFSSTLRCVDRRDAPQAASAPINIRTEVAASIQPSSGYSKVAQLDTISATRTVTSVCYIMMGGPFATMARPGSSSLAPPATSSSARLAFATRKPASQGIRRPHFRASSRGAMRVYNAADKIAVVTGANTGSMTHAHDFATRLK